MSDKKKISYILNGITILSIVASIVLSFNAYLGQTVFFVFGRFYVIVVFFSNYILIKNFDKSKLAKFLYCFTCITIVLPWVALSIKEELTAIPIALVIFALNIISVLMGFSIKTLTNENIEKKERVPKFVCNFILIMSIIISIAARIFNIGWLFIIFMFVGFPYFVIFYFSNHIALKYFNETNLAKCIFGASCLTIVAACILMPDFGDIGGGYAFFSLIRNNDELIDVLFIVARILLLINLITIILGFRMPKIAKKKNIVLDDNNSENNTDKDINIKED